MDITKIPKDELRKDLDETYGDIIDCEAALKLGIKTYGNGKSVKERLEANQSIRAKIEAELKRRRTENG